LKKFLWILVVFVFSCNPIGNNETDIVLARVQDHYLYLSDIQSLVPENANARDSMTIVQNFINKWIREQLILNKAKLNLTRQEQDFSQQLEEYRNSLIIYAYESKLMRLNHDTNVSLEDIEQYYDLHKNNFELKENIIRFNFIKLHVDSPEVNQFRSLIRRDDPEDMHELEDLCKSYSADYWLEDDWMYFDDILNQIPLEIDNQAQFLSRNEHIDLRSESFRYFARIKDYKLQGSISPIAFETSNIKSIIINKRKLELVKNMRKDLMNVAVSSHEVEVY